jgi:uncharacterized protein (DUF608 family)
MAHRSKIPYPKEELFSIGEQRKFTGKYLTEVAFPIGGIGTGTISLGGRGNLRDFEIFNKPNKGYVIPFTFFALWAKRQGEEPVAKILEGKIPPPYRHGFGEPQQQLQGVARFSKAEFQGKYPVAKVWLTDPDVPVEAVLTAWNPFIPLNIKDSALPVAIFEWTFINQGNKLVELSLAASMSNPVMKVDAEGNHISQGSVNLYRKSKELHGIFMFHPEADEESPHTGSLALTTTWQDVDVQTHWYRGGWWDKCHIFWDDFADDGKLNETKDIDPAPSEGDVASLAMRAIIAPGESVTIPVYITWFFPRMENPWPPPVEHPKVLETYVGKHFVNAWEVAEYVSDNHVRLWNHTSSWQRAIFDNTLPAYVIEAITSQVSTIRTCTCFLLKDGSFFAWEGCGDKQGCCHGSCTHVWNYEQTLAFLFPELERSMRKTEFLYNTRETGHMGFRTYLPPGSAIWEFKPCADGQMGTIIQVYRDWQLSGNDDFLKEIWPKIKLALEYAWKVQPEHTSNTPGIQKKQSYDSIWDPDKDGVMEGEQHNTYDIEFFGPNTMCTAMYLGALRAAEEIAKYLGEYEKAQEYRDIYESGRSKVETELWNGEYYIQKVKVIPEVTVPEVLKSPQSTTCKCKNIPGNCTPAMTENEVIPKYQYGDGCLSDQLLGQLLAHVAGLGYILDREHVKTAVKSIFDYNFKSPIDSFSNVQRVYALNDEAGLVLCSWPRGNRPALPFVYSDEVWTGIEFQVAAHLIYEGWIEEGLAIVKAVTERYRGDNRNPWNHIECGHHYARAMASWAVKLALDGFKYSLVEHRLGFAPRIHTEDYFTFWSTNSGWGTYSQNLEKGFFALTVDYGCITLKTLELANLTTNKITINGPKGKIEATVEPGRIVFQSPITLSTGDMLIIATEQ